MPIRFLSDQCFDTGGPGKGPRFAAGQVLALSDVAKALGEKVTPEYAEGFLNRWVQHGVAVYVDDAEAKAAPKAAEPAVTAVSEATVSAPLGTARQAAKDAG